MTNKKRKFGELEMVDIENTPYVSGIDWVEKEVVEPPQLIKVKRISSARGDKFLVSYEGDVRLAPLEFLGKSRFFEIEKEKFDKFELPKWRK